ncbi:hypothetical protein CAUP111243_05385 [Campylobacter upsaliensis]|uniref:Uncharacterized protein n=1 Tax=Campylobacter upsaliensis TaxID=28080 RepID=A0A448KQ80_CAMUP|nr:hypothetical protein [Campylobacter upsaliensis]MCA5589286.1 hypothetical protein [Campylobacter upsaliensis]VEG85539.1 Uncharacterised protein [Campylobacter upsaliensis]
MVENMKEDSIKKLIVSVESSDGQKSCVTFVREKDSKELIRALEGLKEILESVQGDKKKLEKELDETKDNKKELEINLRRLQEENQALKVGNEALEQKNNKTSQTLENLKRELDETKDNKKELEINLRRLQEENLALKVGNEALEQKNNKTSQTLENLKNEVNIELYEFYKSLSSQFRSNFTYIKDDNLIHFNATSTNRTILKSLYGFIENEKCEDSSIIELFNKLFPLHEELYGFKRLEVKEGDNFNNKEHTNIKDSKGQGSIKKVCLVGFKDGNDTSRSLVEL